MAHVGTQASKWQNNDLKPSLSDSKPISLSTTHVLSHLEDRNLIPKPNGDEDSSNQMRIFRIFFKSECGLNVIYNARSAAVVLNGSWAGCTCFPAEACCTNSGLHLHLFIWKYESHTKIIPKVMHVKSD